MLRDGAAEELRPWELRDGEPLQEPRDGQVLRVQEPQDGRELLRVRDGRELREQQAPRKYRGPCPA